MTIEGYLIDVDFDGDTLRARGRNKVGHVALLGPDKDQPEAVIPRTEMETVTFKDASPLVNGKIVIETNGGKRYQLHFRRKQAKPFRELAKELGAA